MLVFTYNDYQQSKYLSSANVIGSSLYSMQNSVYGYFRLSEENEKLVRENVALRNQMDMMYAKMREMTDSTFILRELPQQKMIFRDAKVLKSSTNRMHNYITIDRGKTGGVMEDMVAIDGETGGVVGLVTATSDNFAIILPIINTSFRLSAKLKESNFRGQLVWNGVFDDRVILNDIPEHASVHVGDSIVTSGSSSFFPEGILVGVVSEVEMDNNGGFYRLEVKLSTDFNSIYNVEIIENLQLEEQTNLEQSQMQEEE